MTNEETTKEKLEIARSKVRRIITYVALGIFASGFAYGMIWMGDRSITMVGINAALAVIFFWFGARSAIKPPELK